MRAAVRLSLIIVAIAGLCVIPVAITRSQRHFGDRETVTTTMRPAATVADSNNWPMFRGEQRLLGRASGTLPDSLALLWRFRTDGQIKSSPAIVNDLVFIGSSDANVYAIDLQNGGKVWAYKVDDAVEATPCVVDGSVFIGSSGGFFYALEATDGSLRWKYQTDGQILGAANWTHSPNGRDTWIVVGSYDNKLHCVDSASGKAVWTYETDNYINGSPAVDEHRAVFGGCDAMIHVVSLADGSVASQIDSGSFIAASAATLEGQVYVGNYDNVFIRADIAAARIVWKYENSDSPFFSSPAVGENVVIFGGRDSLVHCVDRDGGKVVWTFQTLGEVDSSPAICGDKVIIGSEDGRLYMIRLSDGTKIWSYEIGQAISSSPAVAKGMVVIGCDDGCVYAFGAK